MFFRAAGLMLVASCWALPAQPSSAATEAVAFDPLAFELNFGEAGPLEQVEIYAARNGTFAGKVLVVSDKAIPAVRAKLTEMRSGSNRIPPAAVTISYATVRGPTGNFDALLPSCPKTNEPMTAKQFGRGWKSSAPAIGKAIVAVWITFDLPKTIQHGTYKGKLAVTAGRKRSFAVPITLHVADWSLPDPSEYRTFVELVQSPESVAMQYGVRPWSDRHFKLLAESLKWMGRVGNKTTYIHLIGQTNQGNAETMVRWLRTPRGYVHDFSIVDKYLDVVTEHVPNPKAVCLYVWDTYLEGGLGSGRPDDGVLRHEPEATRRQRQEHQGKGPLVTVVDRTKKLSTEALPSYTDPASKELWRPLLEGLQSRLSDRGMSGAMVLGMVTDVRPSKEVVDFFGELLPDMKWMRRGHMRISDVHGASLALQLGPSYNKWAYDLNPGGSLHGWNGRKWRYPGLSVHFPRGHRNYISRCVYRLIGEVNIAGSQRGFGGYGADFWRVVKDKRGRARGTLAARYPKTSWRNLNISNTLLAPGPNGALPTARYQMMKEGVQECEARILIEQALLDEDSQNKLGSELVRRCRNVLDERIAVMKSKMTGSWAYSGFHWETKKLEYPEFIDSGWAERAGKLFDLAGEVARKLQPAGN